MEFKQKWHKSSEAYLQGGETSLYFPSDYNADVMVSM